MGQAGIPGWGGAAAGNGVCKDEAHGPRKGDVAKLPEYALKGPEGKLGEEGAFIYNGEMVEGNVLVSDDNPAKALLME